MFDTLDEIQRQLEVLEDARAEFKEVVLGSRGVRSPNTEDMAGEMVAFANAEGGVIFLGVDDGGVVRGDPCRSCGRRGDMGGQRRQQQLRPADQTDSPQGAPPRSDRRTPPRDPGRGSAGTVRPRYQLVGATTSVSARPGSS